MAGLLFEDAPKLGVMLLFAGGGGLGVSGRTGAKGIDGILEASW